MAVSDSNGIGPTHRAALRAVQTGVLLLPIKQPACRHRFVPCICPMLNAHTVPEPHTRLFWHQPALVLPCCAAGIPWPQPSNEIALCGALFVAEFTADLDFHSKGFYRSAVLLALFFVCLTCFQPPPINR